MASFNFSTSGNPAVEAAALQFMNEQFLWGQQQFAQNSQLTDQVVGDLMNLYGSLSGVGNTLMSEYNSLFLPEYQQLVNDANNYASTARIQQAMGAAESGTAQAFNGQRNAALADLQSFGIDPSSGRYAQLDAAERTQQAAAMAGAGFQAEQATEATGRALRSEALQLGSVMPSQATAAYNASQGAATAAENARLANSQEGLNLMGSPLQWGNLANQMRSGSSGSSGGGSPKGGGGGGNRGPTPIQRDPTWDQTSPPNYGPMGASQADAINGRGGGGGGNFGAGSGAGPFGRFIGGGDGLGADQGLPSEFGGAPMQDWTQQSGGTQQDLNGDQWNPSTATQPWPTDTNPATPPDYTGETGALDFSGGSSDTNSSGNSDSGYNYSGDGGASYDNSGYAKGGVVPYHKSPSNGKETDDVDARLNGTHEPIRLNAGEFIVPRHTVKWYGEKYFQNLIARSKVARGEAPGKPTMRPALPAQRHAHG